MAKKSSGGVYRVTEIIGSSKTSWEDAAKNAVQTASKTLRTWRKRCGVIFLSSTLLSESPGENSSLILPGV